MMQTRRTPIVTTAMKKLILMADTYRETKSRFTWIGEIEDERLLSALEKLKEEDLKILTLYAYDGYTVTEISKVLRCSQPTISIKIKRITKFLKTLNLMLWIELSRELSEGNFPDGSRRW